MDLEMQKEIEGFRLSPQQKHLWQLQQIDPSMPYRIQCAVLIEGNLKVKTLKTALHYVVNRHEILRTTYSYVPGMTIPLQVITDNGIAWGQNYDWSSCTFQEQEDALEKLLDESSQQPFDLVQGPLLQLSLATLSPSKHVLLVSLPALCADTATLRNLVREISQSYAACLQGEALKDTPLQYADLAEWQNQLLEGADTEAGRDYWRKQDFSALPGLQLPFEKQIAEKTAFVPQIHTLKIEPGLTARIEALVQQYGTTVSEFFLTCWQVLLWRLTGQPNLITGVGCDGRKYEELETALGLFAKYLPLHCHLKEDSKFSEILQRTKESIGNVYKWQEYFTWKKIAKFSQNTSFFPLCFEFEKWHANYSAADISFSIYQQYACIDRFKVKLSCLRQQDRLNVAFHYDANLFLTEDIQCLAGQFQTLIESAIAYPDTAISKLQILSDRERHKLLVEFNQNRSCNRRYTQMNETGNEEQCIHQVFEKGVASTPDKVAIVFEDQQLTYAELNTRANKIAHYLQQLGVGAEVLVGLYLERSPLMIVGILGILKAGGAYVPLDPAYPKERLAFMLQNAQPSVLLTQENLTKELPEHADLLVCLDTNWPLIAQQPAENLNCTAVAANLAYVIYTSGSTGTPKGVRITHANLCHYVQAMAMALGIAALDVYLHTASIAFSSSVRQLMVPLSQGATVKIATSEQRKDPLVLFEEIKRHEVTVIDIVPSYWRNCTHALSRLEPKSRNTLLDNKLRLIVSASEPLLSDIPSKWTFGFQHGAHAINMFGQTETCGIVAVYPISAVQDDRAKVVPLGRPLANTQIYLLDRHLQPVPIGVPGELYIGGLGNGQGYLNRPDLTAEKFIPNPYSNEPGGRLYKTGDLGRYLPDGTIEFVGRSDYQVKIRGFRIELGEIEAALGQHPGVREAVVLAREDEPGDKRLVAYVVPNESAPMLRSFLQEKLPDYMVPSTFVMLEALPLLPNGKVNRQALPARDRIRPEKEKTFAPPRTPVEEVLAGIWAQILGLEQVGIHDNFFELGGHSLLATQVVSQVREAFQVELPLRSLFEAPTVAGLGYAIETAMRAGQGLFVPPIERVARDGELPLSFAQQRLWFLDQLEPGSFSYNVPAAVRLSGQLNVAALEQSFNEIVLRHEALRTSFALVEDRPVQAIAKAVSIKLPVVDLRSLPETKRSVEAQRLATEKALQPFDLAQGPLLRVTLLRLNDKEHVLILTMHHIVSDGWSMGVLIRELAALYAAFSTVQPMLLPGLPIQYADFAVWQRQWLQGAILQAQLNYWKQQLGGSLPVLELPTDRPRPAIQTFQGAKQSLALPKALTEALKALSRREGVTLFMTLLAAFNTLLYRYTGQEDILVGSPIANRDRVELETLIGCFVNTLVLRTDLSGNPSFQELLGRVREVALEAYAHQNLPFEKLVEELQPERNLSHNPLFQVMFILQNAPMEDLELPGLTLNLLEVDSETARFDLTLSLTDTEQGLIGFLEYNTDLFDAATMTRMLGHFQTLLEGIVANPQQHLSALPILTQPERQQLLVEWNHTQADYPKRCIHELFEAQVERSPDAIAVVFEDQHLIYGELNARANKIAHYLRSLGVGPDVLVGICLERSLLMVIGLFGILKAGGAYVPLDPTYPQERLAFMLEDAEVPVLLTQEKLVAGLPKHKAKVLCLDVDWKEIAKESDRNPISKAITDDLAYLIYTSGSTGRPKGVQILHDALVNFLSTMRLTLGVTEEDTLLSVTTLSFDIAALEVYLPLIVGARLVVVNREVATDGTQLLRLVSSGATVMQATPATWRLLLAAGWQGSWSLKILCGGEALDCELANQLLIRGTELWNLYGPTETTIWSAAHKVDPRKSEERRDGLVSIGRPIANTQFYILDQNQQPVPVGVAGELHIGGVGLARGYLNRPKLTVERFIANPFNNEPGARLYKTGDLVRYLSDGNIEFIGRIDHQVKIRGFRIELAEIEAALRQHSAVREVVVQDREDSPGEKRLVGYVVPHQEQAPTISDLHQFLRENLPEYMVPSAFVLLSALPLTPNGKVDRRSLPEPDPARPEQKEIFVTPRTPVEEVLAGIWAQVLGLKQVGIEDNFFDLGGHSLLATQVISRVRDVFQLELSLRCLFETPTVAGLVKRIETAMRAGESLKAPPIARISRDGKLPLSFAQQRLWFLDQLEPGNPTYNIPAAVHLIRPLNVAALVQSFNEIVRRHEVLRTTYVVIDGQPVQVIAPSLSLTLPVVDLQELSKLEREQEVQRQALEEAQRSFILAQGPLLRVTLLRLGEAEHVLLLTMHHIIADGWTMGVLIQELAALYEAFSTGKPSPLPDLPIQYADFAVWQRQWLQGEVLETKLSYWKQQLGGSLPVLELPTDRPRSAVPTFRGARQSLVLPKTLSEALKALSAKEGVTLFMTLLAVFQTLLHLYTSQNDIVVGTDVASRNRAETEGLIGFFINQLVLRTDLSGNPTFREMLKRVREVTLGAYTHQDLPFDKLVEALNPERSLSRAPLFQVKLILQNAPMPPLELSGLTLSLLKVENRTAEFDLLLNMTDAEQGLIGSLEYNTDLFDAASMTQMLGHFETLLSNVVTQPEIRLDALGVILTEADRQQRSAKEQEYQKTIQQKLIDIKRKSTLGSKAQAGDEL